MFKKLNMDKTLNDLNNNLKNIKKNIKNAEQEYRNLSDEADEIKLKWLSDNIVNKCEWKNRNDLKVISHNNISLYHESYITDGDYYTDRKFLYCKDKELVSKFLQNFGKSYNYTKYDYDAKQSKVSYFSVFEH